MDRKELAEAIGKPQMARLKEIGRGITIGRILGSRVLIKTVVPYTDMDRVQQEGKLVIPKSVKEANTPLPSTGIVIATGPRIQCRKCGSPQLDHSGSLNEFCKFEPIVQEGDMVMFPRFAGTDAKIENEDLRICEAEEILCTLVDVQDSVVQDTSA